MLSRLRACEKIVRLSKKGEGYGRRRWMSRYAAVWGNGDYGRLGLGSLESQWTPKTLLSSAFHNQSIKSIACGGAHTLFLTETGHVYASGLNEFGQLAISNKSYSMEPVQVSGLQKEIMYISAGYHHSCAITVDGELYMWGRNSSGQLGLGKKAKKVVSQPTHSECLSGLTIKMAALGSEHTIAVTDSGEVLSWGGGTSGQLGHGRESSFAGILGSSSEMTPRLVKTLEGIKVKSVGAGLLHSACIDEHGSVFVFGEVVAGNLGFGRARKDRTPLVMDETPNSKEVACGGYHTCVITCGGELYAWGSNENGCLGTGYTSVLNFPERVGGPFLKFPVDKVSCGWKHTAAISELRFAADYFIVNTEVGVFPTVTEGKIFTWGWGGSHGTFSVDGHSSGGQLGHGDDVDYFYPMLVELENNVKALEVSCGFNHTGAIIERIDT